jgi:hypothetical protein
MKPKTLITMAVASAFGWSAGVFAGSGHEVMTPFSPNESGENIVSQHSGLHSRAMSTAMAPTESITEATGHDLALSDSSDWSASFGQMAEADVTEVYVVGAAPMDSSDHYVLGTDSGDSLALLGDDTYDLMPVDVIAFVTDDDYLLSQEDRVDAILATAPVIDTAEVG